MYLKTLFSLSLAILLCFSLNNSLGQPPQYRTEVNKIINNNQMRLQNQMMMQTLGMRGVMSTQEEYYFRVTMLDSTQKEILSAIYTDNSNNRKFIILEDKSYKRSDTNRYKKIFPSQTLSIIESFTEAAVTGNDTAVVKYAYGRPADSCWMFNIKAGTISLLSYRCDGWDNQDSPRTIVGIQLAGDPPVQFTPENLEKMIAGDERAMKYFNKKVYFAAIERFNKDVEKAGKR